ncbi:MAG: lamin tail domain-containing protein [Deltaproteobacteria bacterium]|nr:lamin tail domain-containing protein [Deltaproteobacteria bacterium]
MRRMTWGAALVVLSLATACGSDDDGDGPLGVAQFVVTPTSVAPGGNTLAAWEVTGSRSVRLEACTGFAADDTTFCPSGTVRIVALDDATLRVGSQLVQVWEATRFQLIALGRDGGAMASDWWEVQIDTTPDDGPRVEDFRADPRSIDPGTAATLIYKVRNVTQIELGDATGDPAHPSTWSGVVTIDHDGSGNIDGTRDVTPTTSRLYGIKLPGADGAILGFAAVTVRGSLPTVPNIASFTADPMEVDEGGTVTLSWSTENATTLSISPSVPGFTGTEADGTLDFTPAFTGLGDTREAVTIYTLTAENGTFTDTAQIALLVRARPVIDTFTAIPEAVTTGGSTTLTWATTRADAVVITAEPADATLPATFAVDGTATVTPTATTTYTLTATGSIATPTTATATVTVSSAPVVVIDSFTASPERIAEGGTSVTLTWTTTAATGVSIAAVPADATLPGTFTVDGSATVDPEQTTVYTLTASGPSGPITRTATVEVVEIGDVVVTEVMFDPAGVADTAGEWFEVTNVAGAAIDLAGFLLRSGTATYAVPTTSTDALAVAGWFVFGVNASTAANGGVTVDHQYSTLSFVDTGALTLSVEFDGVVIDAVNYTIAGGWVAGDSLTLNPGHINAVDNDTAANWCAARASDTYGTSGNHGTPGAANACS